MHCAFRLPGLHFPPLDPQTAEHKPRQLSQGELKLETVLGLSVKSLRQLVNFSGTHWARKARHHKEDVFTLTEQCLVDLSRSSLQRRSLYGKGFLGSLPTLVSERQNSN